MNYSNKFTISLTFGILLVFSDCTVTIPTILGIENAARSRIIKGQNIENIQPQENIIIYFVEGDSLKARYIGNQYITDENSDIELTVENDVKSKNLKSVLIEEYNSEIKLIPLNRIKGIKVDYRPHNIMRGMLGGLLIDTIIFIWALSSVDWYPCMENC